MRKGTGREVTCVGRGKLNGRGGFEAMEMGIFDGGVMGEKRKVVGETLRIGTRRRLDLTKMIE